MAEANHDGNSLKPLQHQVAGHPSSVLASSDGSYIVKPSLPLEIDFYETTAPRYFGKLIDNDLIPRYCGVQDNEAGAPSKGPKAEKAVKLENLTAGYTHPNVIDIKLGTQLFDPLDPRLTPEKQARMEAESRNTTSGPDGLRMTGFTVYDAKTGKHVATPKEYGKAIPSSELINAIRRFLPCNQEDASIHTHSDLTPPPPAGYPAKYLVKVIDSILERLELLTKIVASFEWRVYGGSLLIVYEGSPPANDDDDGTLGGGATKVTVKMIDFAHARHLPGQGPDEGQLKGIGSATRLLEQRREELSRF